MVTNIDALADKIYQEGVVKAENEANEIIKQATEKAAKIIKEAERTSDEMRENAKKQALEIQKNALSDLKLASNKAINTLRQQIKTMLQQKVLKQPIEALFLDEDFLKDLIITIAKNHSAKSMTVLLPEKMKDKLDKALSGSIVNSLEGLKIDFNKGLTGGFQILRDDLNYVITFTDTDFIEFFKPFLNDSTEKILFKD